MRTHQYLSSDVRLTDELERQLMQEALLAQGEYDIIDALRRGLTFVVAKVAALLNARRRGKGLPGEYLFS